MKQQQRNFNALASLQNDQAVLDDLQNQVEGIKTKIAETRGMGLADGLGVEVGNESQIERAMQILEGVPQDFGVFAEPEAIILSRGRPALLIQDNGWEPSNVKAIDDRLLEGAPHILAAIPKVGRVELLNHADYNFVGTGWMIDEDVIITNRHVAEVFTRREGRRAFIASNPEGSVYQSQIDYLAEHERSNAFEIQIKDVVYLEERGNSLPDMALLRLNPNGAQLPAPIELSERLPSFGADIAVIGYPAYDSRNDVFVMRRIFQDIYNVKRLAPGKVIGVSDDGFLVRHDCTTMGGNSGSVVLSLETGKALALHFSGSFGVSNYAVSCAVLNQKLATIMPSRISVPAPPSQQGEPEPEPQIPDPFDLGNSGNAGDPGFAPLTPLAPVAHGATSAKGYQSDFLGESFVVPFPVPSDLSQIAPVQGREDGVLDYTHFSVVMNQHRRLALFTGVNIDGKSMHNVRRGRDKWSLDDRISPDHQAGEGLYKNNPLDRGHLVRRLDPAWGDRDEAKQAVKDTFHFTNCAPQHLALNQRTWLGLEDYILDSATTHDLRVNVFTGPIFRDSDRTYRGILLPEEFWKVVTIVNAFTNRLSATAYLLSQRDHLADLEFVFGAYKTYQVPVATVAGLTGLNFGELTDYDPIARNESLAGVRILESVEQIIL